VNRREALKTAGFILGTSIIGANAFLSSCVNTKNTFILGHDELIFLNEFAETILPKTDSPGAKEADVASFMNTIVKDFYSTDEQNIFLAGIKDVNDLSDKKFNKDFIDLSFDEKKVILMELENEAKTHYTRQKQGDHFYIMFKQLTIWAFLSSETVVKNAFIFSPLIAKYTGSIDYRSGDKIVYSDFGRSGNAYGAAFFHIKNS
jgi:glucoside 3-dehydrogenase (cytochrome c) hitch-hiker subunit